MAFPHPQPGKDHERKKDKPSRRRITRKFVERTVNVAEYWNGKDEVNPAKNGTLAGNIHGRSPSVVGATYVSALFTIGEPPGAASWESLCRTAWHTQRSIAASLRTSWPRVRRCVQWARPRGVGPTRRSRCASPRHPSRCSGGRYWSTGSGACRQRRLRVGRRCPRNHCKRSNGKRSDERFLH